MVHNIKYAFKTMLRNKTAIIWTLLFPMALGTFMYMAFGNIFEQDMMFHSIPVAVVQERENIPVEIMLTELSREGEEQVLQVTYCSEEEAKIALEEEEVTGILYIREELKLTVSENSHESAILKTIMDEYKKQEAMFRDIVMYHPEAMKSVMTDMTGGGEYFTAKITSDGNQDLFTNYFYAIFAMSCLFGSFGAQEKIGKIQANVSALGMRRCLSPNRKAAIIVSEFLSLLLVQFLVEVVSLVYFVMIGVDFGNHYPQILGILFFGSCIGISLGVIIGAMSKWDVNQKSAVCVVISMALSVMADLVAAGIKDDIEHTAPIINRINPAALIVDSFYALNIYDTYDRYMKNMMTLGGMALVLLIISVFMLRRNRYASV